jgi:transcriptional regulator with XRE-family HTH domain
MTEFDSKKIGNRLKEVRKKNALTQKDIVKIFKLSDQNLVSRYENGILHPPLKFLIDFSEYFDVAIDWILKGKETKR